MTSVCKKEAPIWVNIYINGEPCDETFFYRINNKKKYYFYFTKNGKHYIIGGIMNRLTPQFSFSMVTRPDFNVDQIEKINTWKTGVTDFSCKTGNKRVDFGERTLAGGENPDFSCYLTVSYEKSNLKSFRLNP